MPDDAEANEADASRVMSESENEFDDTDDAHLKNEDEKMADQNGPSEGVDANGEVKKKYDPKDPMRPRRKKARRACFACQRAHLTCGMCTWFICFYVCLIYRSPLPTHRHLGFIGYSPIFVRHHYATYLLPPVSHLFWGYAGWR